MRRLPESLAAGVTVAATSRSVLKKGGPRVAGKELSSICESGASSETGVRSDGHMVLPIWFGGGPAAYGGSGPWGLVSLQTVFTPAFNFS